MTSNSRSPQLSFVFAVLMRGCRLGGSTSVFYFSVSLFSLSRSMGRGLRRHHSNHFSTEIHPSTPEKYLFTPPKWKYQIFVFPRRNTLHNPLSRLSFFFFSKDNYFPSDQRYLFTICREYRKQWD